MSGGIIMNGRQLNMLLKRVYEIKIRAQEIGNIWIEAIGAEDVTIHEDLKSLLAANYNLIKTFEEMDK